MFGKTEESEFLDTLRVSDAELESIIAEELCNSRSERQWLRRSTNLMRMTATVHQPGGSVGKYAVRSYDLCEGGVGFFTGHYLHASSRCQLGIWATDGEVIGVDGTINRCTNVRGHIHLAGVEFDRPIDLSWFDSNVEGILTNSNTDTLAVLEELRNLVTCNAASNVIQVCYDRLGDALLLNGADQSGDSAES